MFRSPFVWEVQVRRELLERSLRVSASFPQRLARAARPAHAHAPGPRRPHSTASDTVRGLGRRGAEDIRVTVALETVLHRGCSCGKVS